MLNFWIFAASIPQVREILVQRIGGLYIFGKSRNLVIVFKQDGGVIRKKISHVEDGVNPNVRGQVQDIHFSVAAASAELYRSNKRYRSHRD